MVCTSIRLINREAVYEKLKLFHTRLYKYNLFKISNIPYNLFITTKFNNSSILTTIIYCDYLNLSLATSQYRPSQRDIKYNQNVLQSDQPIRLQYSNQIKLFVFKGTFSSFYRYILTTRTNVKESPNNHNEPMKHSTLGRCLEIWIIWSSRTQYWYHQYCYQYCTQYWVFYQNLPVSAILVQILVNTSFPVSSRIFQYLQY